MLYEKSAGSHGSARESGDHAVFELDDDAVVVVLQERVPVELETKAAAGVRACPVAALDLVR